MADYEALAVRLSRNADELAGLKSKLAANRRSGPLFATPRIVNNLQSGYRQMWRNLLFGKLPTRIDVAER